MSLAQQKTINSIFVPTTEDITCAFDDRNYELLIEYHKILDDKLIFLAVLFRYLYHRDYDKIDVHSFLLTISKIFELEYICYRFVLFNNELFDDSYDIIDMLKRMCIDKRTSLANEYINNLEVNLDVLVVEYLFFKGYITRSQIEYKIKETGLIFQRGLLHILSYDFILLMAIRSLRVEIIEYYMKYTAVTDEHIALFVERDWYDEESIKQLLTIFENYKIQIKNKISGYKLQIFHSVFD